MNKIKSIKEKSTSYLSFRVGEELFAAHVAFVNNIIEVPQITSMPNVPDYMLGVVNLRGTVLPVVDTRLKLQMPAAEITTLSCILVLEIEYNKKIISVGALVDSVQEVIEIEPDEILPPPEISGLKSIKDLITGIVNLDDKMIMLIDINHLFDKEYLGDIGTEMVKLKEAAP